VNGNNSCRLIASDGTGWASDHAYRITAMHARLYELQAVMNDALADESRIAIMDIRTSFNAIIASGAPMQIDHHRVTGVVQSILNDEFQ